MTDPDDSPATPATETQSESDKSTTTDLSDIRTESHPSLTALLIVVLSRVFYSGGVVALLTYVIGRYVFQWELPVLYTSDITLTAFITSTVLSGWTVLFAGTSILVIAIGFRLWVVLSWGTAYLLCPSVRTSLNEFMDEYNETTDSQTEM